MGFFKNLKKKMDEAAENKPRGFKVTDKVVRRYCKLREAVENGEIEKSYEDYRKFERLGLKIRREGYDLDELYDEFKDDREFLSEEEREHLDVAEEIFEDKDEIKEEVRYVVVQKGVPFVKDREVDRTGPDGRVERIKETNIPIAACGKKLSSEADVEGFCSVCDKGICSDHAEYCAGYGTSRCGKLLCPDHVLYFTGSNGDSYPCSNAHYELRDNFEFQETQPSRPRPDHNPSQTDDG